MRNTNIEPIFTVIQSTKYFMEALKPGQIRVHRQGGYSYDCPESNKKYVIRCLADLERIEHYKPAKPVAYVAPPPPAPPEKTKASLLGKLLKDNKILLPEMAEWLGNCNSIEDIGIAMEGEKRAGAKKAAKERITVLLK